MKYISSFIVFGVIIGASITLAACSPSQTSSLPEQNEERETHRSHAAIITSEKAFIENMIPHHVEAIETSQLVTTKTENSELRKFAADVITTQSQEVEQMKNWLQEWYSEEYGDNASYQPMMGDLTVLNGEALDQAYIAGMILHHQGAIDMAEQVLTLNPRPEIQDMARNIITVQQTEVETLQGWLENSPGQTSVSPANHGSMGH